MVVVLRGGVPGEKIEPLISWLKGKGLGVREFHGQQQCVLGLIGDTAQVDVEMLRSLDIVESVGAVSDPFKAANRKIHPEDTVVCAGAASGAVLGGGHFAIIAGPCSVEDEAQITLVAEKVKAAGAAFLRGGAF